MDQYFKHKSGSYTDFFPVYNNRKSKGYQFLGNPLASTRYSLMCIPSFICILGIELKWYLNKTKDFINNRLLELHNGVIYEKHDNL